MLDITLVVAAPRPHHLHIVPRQRHARSKPLISHMVRLYQYPTADLGATGREGLKRLPQAAPESPVPRMLPGAKRWTVYVSSVHGCAAVLGPFHSPGVEMEAFITETRSQMQRGVAVLCRSASAA